MTHSTEMTIEELMAEIEKAEAFELVGDFTAQDKTFLKKQMVKHKKMLKDKIKAQRV
jgi:hypothetical protein